MSADICDDRSLSFNMQSNGVLIEFECEMTLDDVIDACNNEASISPQFRPIFKKGFQRPNQNDVYKVVVLILDKGYSKLEVGFLLGLTDEEVLDRWMSDKPEVSAIPYAFWRLLCAYAGMTIDASLKAKW